MHMTEVDTNRLLSVKSRIANDIGGILKIRDTLKGPAINGLAPYWQGQAQDLFVQRLNAFLTVFEGFMKHCERLNAELERAGKTYSDAEAEVKALVAKQR
jgi:uncharacterized protein YukE